MATSKQKSKPAKKSTVVVKQPTAKAARPVFGGSALELFQAAVHPSLDRRQKEWMADVGEKLKQLEKNGLALATLQNNETFVSAALYASQLALRTHSKEKLEALRNGIVNIAKGQAPDETMQHVFLNMVDRFTELHLQVLKAFQSPTPPRMKIGKLSVIVEHSVPSLQGKQALYDQLWKDLFACGLVDIDHLHVTMTRSGLIAKRTTALADKFLNFIV